MADKGGLQLLPETRKKIEVKIPGQNRLISIGVILLIVVLGIVAGLWFYQNSLNDQIAQADTQIKSLETKRDPAAEQNLLTLSKQMSITDQILQSHLYWSDGLTRIENAMQGKVQIKSFSATLQAGSIQIQAVADNYTTLAHQLAAFLNDDSITDVTLNNVNVLPNGQLNFSLQVDFNANKFLKNLSQ